MRENNRRKFYADTDVHTVGLGRDCKIFADLFHPFTSTSSNGNDTFLTFVRIFFTYDTVSTVDDLNRLNRCIKEEVHLILHLIVEILKNNVIDICSQMTYRCIQKIQFVLKTKLFKFCSGCGVQFCTFSTIFHIDLIDVLHQLNSLFFTDILK